MQAEAVAAYAGFFPTETPGVQGMHLVSDVGFHLPATWFACADRLTRVAQGSLVRVDRQGPRLGPPAVIRLETADKAQDALNFGKWLATGQRLPDCVVLRLVTV